MQHHLLENRCPNAVASWHHWFHVPQNSPHSKYCAQPSSLTTGRQDPQVLHCSFQGPCLDTEAAHLEISRQVPLAQPSTAVLLLAPLAPCRSCSSASAPCCQHSTSQAYFIWRSICSYFVFCYCDVKHGIKSI